MGSWDFEIDVYNSGVLSLADSLGHFRQIHEQISSGVNRTQVAGN